jgi:hypothetical protein
VIAAVADVRSRRAVTGIESKLTSMSKYRQAWDIMLETDPHAEPQE